MFAGAGVGFLRFMVCFGNRHRIPMTTALDLLFVILIAVVWPLFDYLVLWPAFLRRVQTGPARARKWIWAVTIAEQWALVAAGIALWWSNERDWASLGLPLPEGWRLWGSVGDASY